MLPKGACVTMKQPFLLLNVCTIKIKSNSKHFRSSRMVSEDAKWQIFIHTKTYSL